MGSSVTLNDNDLLVIQRMDTPIDLAKAIEGKTFQCLHIHGKPRNLQLIAHLTHLTELHLQSTGHKDFSEFGQLTRLEDLSYFSGGLNTLDLSFAAGTLKRLHLGKQRSLTDLTPIEKCQHLKSLKLSHMPNITGYPRLQVFPNLRYLELINLRTWPSLRELTHTPDLYWLCIGRTRVNDGHWEILLELPKLEFVGGLGDAFGKEAREEFKKQRPEVRVP